LLVRLAAHSAANGQTPRALAGVFGPLLLWPAAQAAGGGAEPRLPHGASRSFSAASVTPQGARLEETARPVPARDPVLRRGCCRAPAWACSRSSGRPSALACCGGWVDCHATQHTVQARGHLAASCHQRRPKVASPNPNIERQVRIMELLILSARPRAAPARPASPDAAREDGGEGRVKPHSPAAAPVGLQEPRGAPWQAGGPLPYAAVQGARGASPGRSRGRAPGGPLQPPARLVSMVHSLRAGAASRPAAASPPRVRGASRASTALDDISGWASSAWGGAETSHARAGRLPLQSSAGPEDVAGWAPPGFGTAPASPRRARRAGPSGAGRENSGNASANVLGRAGAARGAEGAACAWWQGAEGAPAWGAHMGVSPPAGAPDGAAQAPEDTPLGAPALL